MPFTPSPPPLADVRRALAVFAHPDDVDHYAGGTLAGWVDDGVDVAYLIVTRGDAGGFDDTPRERMPVPQAQEGSWEDLLHRASDRDKLLVLAGADEPAALHEWRGHRAIGVVYRPQYERYGNYVPSVLPRRYDAFLFIDETHALHPLHLRADVEHDVPETYPSGV